MTQSIARKLVNVVLPFVPAERRSHMAEDVTPIVSADTKYGPIKFWCPGGRTVSRARMFLAKEPSTVEWIDSMPSTGIFWDLGANVGVYSLLAAKKGLTVYAIEPQPLNHAVLVKNAELNGFRISTLCAAVSDENAYRDLPMALDFGSAETEGTPTPTKFIRLDDLRDFPDPDFIKVDIDGAEEAMIRGGANTLRKAKQVQIEVRKDTHDPVKAMMLEIGFHTDTPHIGNRNIRNLLFTR